MSPNFCLCLPNVSAELIDSETYSEFAPFVRPGERPLLVTVDLWTAQHDTDADFDVDAWESLRMRILVDEAAAQEISGEIAALAAARSGVLRGVVISPLPLGVWGFYDLRSEPYGHRPPAARSYRRGG